MAAAPLRSPDAGQEGNYQPLAEINVTPMVDVMLVLLVIFMITAPLLTVGVPVDLPKTTASKLTAPKQPIIVSINREDAVFIGDHQVDEADLAGRLDALAALDPDRIVYVRGDRAIPYGRLMDLLGIVNTAGFTKVSLIAEAAKPK
ncbi:MAG TPA: biopolymer transporter ExbD [Stellaceae bacterium]|nr:biopolymer transporter ExbD [Stellaceae bacterium]